MPIHFWWKPNNAPISATANRIDIGLELGGDDTSITSPTPGRIKLVEVQGSGAQNRGSAESSQARLMATFHGLFHRNASAQESRRITFEINLGNSTAPGHQGEVQGFDPECILGVDAFVFTFLNREFRVNLPFFLDTRSEGSFMELQAIAEKDGSSGAIELSHSSVLNLRIKRHREIETTTMISGSSARYTGNVIGHLIVQQEEYLLQGAFKARSAAWPASLSAQIIPVPWTGSFAIPFQHYASGNMRIILFNNIADEITPDASFFQHNISGVVQNQVQQLIPRTKQNICNEIKNRLNFIFTDSGFNNPHIFWDTEQGAAADLQTYNSRFSSSGNLRNSQHLLSVPFWTFFVVDSNSISSVGSGEGAEVSHTTSAQQTGNREYLLPYPAPIGSGNKDLRTPIFVRARYFSDHITNRHFSSLQQFINAVNKIAGKLAIVIAHEIGHSLGLMHLAKVSNPPYSESNGSPVLAIMSSSVDTSSFGADMKFTDQVKVIWNRAFGVQPSWDTGYLRNKTWGNNWNTVDWSARRTQFFRLHDETAMGYVGLTTLLGHTPPYAGSGSSVQRGTYIP